MAMTKAQARKRLIEADKKIRKVYFDFNWYQLGGITVAQRNKDISTIQTILEKMINKLK